MALSDFERRVLVSALLPDDEALRGLLATSTPTVNWSAVWERAVAHKVGALVAARVEKAGVVDRLPPQVREPVGAAPAAARQRYAAAQRTLALVRECFEEAGIPFFVTKGCILVEQVYRDPSLRRFHDLDVVVHPDDVAVAERVLREHGFGLNGIGRLLGVKLEGRDDDLVAESVAHQTFPRFHYQIELVPRDRELVPIDLHWRLAPPRNLRLGTESLWSHTRQGSVAGMPILVLDPTAALVHGILHALPAWPATFRLLHLCDVAWALVHRPVEPAEMWRVARAWGVEAQVGNTLGIVAAMFGLDLSPFLRDYRRSLRQRWLGHVNSPVRLIDGAGRVATSAWRRRLHEAEWSLAHATLVENLSWSVQVRRARRLFLHERRQRQAAVRI